MPNSVYKQKQQNAEDSFPIRLTFDGPLWDLHDMNLAADAQFGSSYAGNQRIHFYFANLERFTAFYKRYGLGREMNTLEMKRFQVGERRQGKAVDWSVVVPGNNDCV